MKTIFALIRFCFIAVAAIQAASVWAQGASIGVAARANGNVTGQMGGRAMPIATGTNVFQNQVVATAAASDALLNFRDSTHLEVGPSSRVVLDRYIFNPDGGARQAVVEMATGTFRFVTGISNPRAIKLQTPQATIGIRGTVLEITVINGETVVNVIQGAAIVCLRRQPSNCTQVIGAGGSISATAGDLEVPRTASQRLQPYDPGARESSGGPSGGDPPAGSADTGQT
ncbi:MAG: FecR family protein, partial [Beijerinckiaceae bacterium]